MNRKKITVAVLGICMLTGLTLSGLFAAGSQEVTARDLQFAEPYARLDLPYAASLGLVDNTFEHAYDFTVQRREQFSFEELITTSDYDPVSGLRHDMVFETTADMTFSQRGVGFTDIIYNEMVSSLTKMVRDEETGEVTRSWESFGPERIVHRGYTPDGDYNYDPQLLFSYMLQYPISNRTVTMGETVEVDLPLPILLPQTAVPAEGAVRLTYVGNAAIEGKSYAKFLARIEFDESALPPELGQVVDLSADGYGVYYFGLADKSFYYGSVTLDVSMKTAALLPSFSKFRTPERSIPVRESKTSITLRGAVARARGRLTAP